MAHYAYIIISGQTNVTEVASCLKVCMVNNDNSNNLREHDKGELDVSQRGDVRFCGKRSQPLIKGKFSSSTVLKCALHLPEIFVRHQLP